jgi:proteasome beta subunit
MKPAFAAGSAPALPGRVEPEGFRGDFTDLLQARGLYAGRAPVGSQPAMAAGLPVQTQATTILGFKFADGVLIAGDRRATAGNIVVYDRADKVLEIDSHSVMAIAGVPATAWEMARVLEHSFQYYRRTQLQEMSVGGKVRALSKLLRDNVGMVMQGVGVVVPIFATYEFGPNASGKLYFYDVMGANFEVAEYSATGSGSPAVRGVLYYENTWGEKPLREYRLEEALRLALRALDTAAEADTATGGVDRNGRIFPVMKIISARGIETIGDDQLRHLFQAGRLSGAQVGGGVAQG